MNTEPKTGLDFWEAGALQPDLLFNALLLYCAVWTQATILSIENAPPGSPADGDIFLVGDTPSGDFVGHENALAYWDDDSGAWLYFEPSEGARLTDLSDGTRYEYSTASVTSGAWAAINDAATPYDLVVAIGDETTAQTTGAAKVTFRAPRAFSLSKIKASLTTASSSGAPQYDVNVNGSTILTTKLTIDASEKTSETAAVPAVLSSTPFAIAADDEITIDVDTAGTGAAGAKLAFIGSV